jgi:TolA-binding protein
MDAEISQSEQWLRFIAWLEDNWQRVALVGSVIIAIGIVVAYVIWQGEQKQKDASKSLSLLLVGREEPTGDALLSFAESNSGTAAGMRAQLLAAGALFTEGKYPEAQAQFENFLTKEPGPLTPKARFGVAACKEAQGQVEAAIADYKAIVENPGSGNVIPQARFALARLYQQQGQVELARTQYEELSNAPGSSLSREARVRLQELPPSTTSRQVEIPTLPPAGVTTN